MISTWKPFPVDLPFSPLSPGQMVATCQCNILQDCWEQHVAPAWPPCCNMLRGVGYCLLKFENGQTFHTALVDVAWCCSHLARFMQQCCAQACALARFSIPNTLQQGGQTCMTCWPNNVAIHICCFQLWRSFGRRLQMLGQQRWDILCWNVAIVWSGFYMYNTFGYFKFPLFRTINCF